MIHPPHAGATDGAAVRDNHPNHHQDCTEVDPASACPVGLSLRLYGVALGRRCDRASGEGAADRSDRAATSFYGIVRQPVVSPFRQPALDPG